MSWGSDVGAASRSCSTRAPARSTSLARRRAPRRRSPRWRGSRLEASAALGICPAVVDPHLRHGVSQRSDHRPAPNRPERHPSGRLTRDPVRISLLPGDAADDARRRGPSDRRGGRRATRCVVKAAARAGVGPGARVSGRSRRCRRAAPRSRRSVARPSGPPPSAARDPRQNRRWLRRPRGPACAPPAAS